MRKEIPLLVAGAMILHGCSNMEASAKTIDTATPQPKSELYDPNLEIQFTPTPDYSYLFATSIPTATPTPDVAKIEPFPYFSQKTYTGRFRYNEDGSSLNEIGCGMFVGAMVTGLDPDTYIQSFFDYFKGIGFYGPARSTGNGTDLRDHIAVLSSLGFTVKDLTTNSTPQEVKIKIKELTAKGIPVWVDAKLYGLKFGHHTMAIGVTPGGTLIFNDPEYGEAIQIQDEDIQMTNEANKNDWRVFAVFPPND